MGIPLHSKLRRMLRSSINHLLIKISKKQLNLENIPTHEIKKILIVRINYRIGNIIFLTPLINALAQKMPHAKIDILIGAKFIAPLLAPMNNVNIVYDVPRKLLKNPFKLINKVKEINANDYDLLISPIISSGSANASTLLIKAKFKLGFYCKETWSAANITIPYPDKTAHEALIPLALMSAFADDHKCIPKLLDINLSEQELIKGKSHLSTLLAKQGVIRNKENTVIGIFRDARHDKKIEDSWWLNFLEQLLIKNPHFILVDILPPNVSDVIHPKALSISFNHLRDLGCFMSSLDFFICADTGPMHLASASFTPVIAFFNATSADKYGPLGEYDRVVNVLHKPIDEVVNETHQNIQDINRVC